MPAPSERHDPAVEELATKYERAGALMAGVLAAFAAGAVTPDTLAAARAALAQVTQALLAASLAWIGLNLPVVYRGGVEDAVRVLQGPSQDELRRQVDETMQSPAHREAMASLAETLKADLENAIAGMNRDANSGLSEIRQRNVMRALSAGSPLSGVEEFAREVERVGFTDRAGKKWKPEVYARTVLLTNVANALNTGHLNRTLEMGSRYVRVSDGGPGDVDTPCLEASGQVWHVLVAAANLTEHPRCRRSFAGLDPEYSGQVDREAE